MSRDITSTRRYFHRPKGFAMLVVVIALTATMLLAAVHQRHLSSALQLETAAQQATLYQQGPLTALAEGLDLLQTGIPPTDNYTCGYTINSPRGPRYFRLQFVRNSSLNWSVTADEVTSLTGLPTAPLAFER